MEARRQMIDVPISISDWVGQNPEALWAAVQKDMTSWLVRAFDEVLAHEVDVFVGAQWHQRRPGHRKTYRCGYRKRRFMVLGHEVVVRMPRVRQAGFRSELLGFRRRRGEDVDRAIVEAYVAGASMREVTASLHAMWNSSVSPSTVSVLVRELDGERQDFQSRTLADDYLYLALDGMYVRCQVAPSARLAAKCPNRPVRITKSMSATRMLIDPTTGMHCSGARARVMPLRIRTWKAGSQLSVICV